MGSIEVFLQRMREIIQRLEELPMIPIKAETLGHFPYCPRRAYFDFIFSIFQFARKKLQLPSISSAPNDFTTLIPTDVTPVALLNRTKLNGDFIKLARTGLPFPRKIQIHAGIFQIQATYTDVMENEKEHKRRVIEIHRINGKNPSSRLLNRIRYQAQIKSWVLSKYVNKLSDPSIAIFSKKERRILTQELVPFSSPQTEKDMKGHLNELYKSQLPEAEVTKICENCSFQDLCHESSLDTLPTM